MASLNPPPPSPSSDLHPGTLCPGSLKLRSLFLLPLPESEPRTSSPLSPKPLAPLQVDQRAERGQTEHLVKKVRELEAGRDSMQEELVVTAQLVTQVREKLVAQMRGEGRGGEERQG